MTEPRQPAPGGPTPPQPLPQPPGGRLSPGLALYAVFGVVTIALYLLAGLRGWTWHSEQRSAVPGSVRQGPGGYRGYTFWHSGYQGGK